MRAFNRGDRNGVADLKEKESSMETLVMAKEAEETKAQEKLAELEGQRTRCLEASRSVDEEGPKAVDRGDAETMPVDGVASKMLLETEALNVRVKQGLEALLQRAGEIDGRVDAEAVVEESLAALFDGTEKTIAQLQAKAASKESASTDRAAFSLLMLTGLIRSCLTGDDGEAQKNHDIKTSSRSFERSYHGTRRKNVDVGKLVGHVDESSPAGYRKGDVDGDESNGGESGVVERSFLKTRSVRFMMRHNRQRNDA